MKKVFRVFLIMALLLNAVAVFGKDNINSVDERGKTQLILAIEDGKFEEAKRIIAEGADVNKHGREVCSPLCIAARKGNFEIVKLLVEKGAKVNEKSGEDGDLPLCEAVYASSYEIVDYLLKHGAKATIADGDKDYPIDKAFFCKDLRIIELLIKNGSDINKKDSAGKSFAAYCLEESDVQKINLIKKYKIDYKIKPNGKNLLFLMACGSLPHYFYGISDDYCEINGTGLKKELVQLLLDNGIDINEKDENGETVLMQACGNDIEDVDSVKVLVECGADLEVKNEEGKTCIFYAFEQPSVMKYLIYAGADLNVRDSEGKTPFEEALSLMSGGGSKEFFKSLNILYEAMGSPESGISLHNAAAMGNASLVKKLLPNCGDINAPDDDGNYVLYNAVSSGSKETIKLILERNPDFTKINKEINALPVLLRAIKDNSYEITELLLKAGADPNFPKKDGLNKYEYETEDYSALRLVIDEITNPANSINYTTKKGYFFLNLLLSYGADPNKKYGDNEFVDTDFIYAIKSCDEKLISFFMENGGDVFTFGRHGFSPFNIVFEEKPEKYPDKYKKMIKSKYDEKYLNKNATALGNLRFRDGPDVEYSVAGTFKKGTRLKIVEYSGNVEKIDGITSCWVKVEAGASAMNSDGQPFGKKVSGWCFAGYLSIGK